MNTRLRKRLAHLTNRFSPLSDLSDSLDELNMTGANSGTPSVPPSVVNHELYTNFVDIPKFSGVSKTIDIKTWVDQLDTVTAERLHKDIKSTTSMGEVVCLLQNYADLPQTLDPHIMTISQQQSTSKSENTHQQNKTGQRKSRDHSRTQNVANNRPRSSSRPAAGVCYNCLRPGHIARDCYSRIRCHNCGYSGHKAQTCKNAPWCEHHQMTGHTTAECRMAKNQNFRARSPSPAPQN